MISEKILRSEIRACKKHLKKLVKEERFEEITECYWTLCALEFVDEWKED